MKLEDLPGGTPIFVDANIFIYHFSGISLECRAFLQRCESRQVEAFKQHLDSLRRKDSLRGAETTEISVRLGKLFRLAL